MGCTVQLIVCKDKAEGSKTAAKILAECIKSKPNCVLGLATGSTPLEMYKELVKMHFENGLDFRKVTTFNLDEYYPINNDDEQSYHTFMEKNLFCGVNLNPANVHILNGTAKDFKAECKSFEKEIENAGGIDLQVLGIGANGHIGFNEPANALIDCTHLTKLSKSTIKANSRFFKSENNVPKAALTMGIGTILSAKKIVLLSFGSAKKEAMKGVFGNEITTQNPASFLKLHKNVVIICDEAALPEIDTF